MAEQIWIVIAAFNEAGALRPVVEECRVHFPSVVVVDDGSVDQTASEARRGGAIVLRHIVNLGQGASLQTGIEYALRQGATIIVTFDADGQHSVADVSAMISRLKEADADVVLGSRFLGNTIGMPRSKWVTLKLAIAFTWLTSGVRLSDAHNGLRVFTRRAAILLDLKQNRMAHASEIVEFIGKSRLRYVEHPVTIAYSDYSKAKGQSLWGSINIISDLLMRRISR